MITFKPWEIVDNKCIRDESEWERIRSIDSYNRMPRIDRNKSISESFARPLVNVVTDVFQNWRDIIVDSVRGQQLNICRTHNQIFTHVNICPKWENCKWNSNILTISDLLRDLFALIDSCPNLDFLIETEDLSKELFPYKDICKVRVRSDWKNLHLSTFVNSQQQSDEIIPKLLELKSLVGKIGVNWNPVGGIDLSGWLGRKRQFTRDDSGIMSEHETWIDFLTIEAKKNRQTFHSGDTVIAEIDAESNPTDLTIIREVIKQCESAGVEVRIRSLGTEWYSEGDDQCHQPFADNPDEWPKDLQLYKEN